MNHFDVLSNAAHTTSFMSYVDLPRAEEAVHAFLDHNSTLDGDQLADVLAGDIKIGLDYLKGIKNCLDNSEDKHLVKFGALAILSAVAWDYDPTADDPGIVNRNSSAAMSILTEFTYCSSTRIADTAHKLAEGIGDEERDRSTDDIKMALMTHKPQAVANNERAASDIESGDKTDESVEINDTNMRQKIADFPWIDSPLEDIKLDSRLVSGLNGTDVLVIDLSKYSARMQHIIADARSHFDESIFRSMELQQISKMLTGNQSGYVQPPSFRDPNLPDSYCAKSVGNNNNLRRLYVARIGEYEGKPVFARLGFSRTKQYQSELSQLLGYYPVHG